MCKEQSGRRTLKEHVSSNVKKIKTAVEEEYFKHEWPWSFVGGQHPDAK